MSAVWEHSESKSNDRLCLLALADKANDIGYCWPGISDIERQMNATRQTVLNSLDRLEAQGELYAERRQRVGSKYLVLPGLTDDQIVAGLVTHFKMDETAAKATLSAILEKRYKSRNHTSNKDENLDRINAAKKSTNHTKKVYGLDQKSLAARPDPSITVNNDHIGAADADAPDAAVVADEASADPTPDSGPQQNARDVVRDEIIEACRFAETARNEKETYGRAGQITRYLMGLAVKRGGASYQLAREDWRAQPGDFKRFAQWWRGKFPNADVPRSLDILSERWAEWREAEAQRMRLASVGPRTAALNAERALYGEQEVA